MGIEDQKLVQPPRLCFSRRMPDRSLLNDHAFDFRLARPSQILVERYGSRHWAVIEDGELLCGTVYKKGANAVAERLRGGTKAPDIICD